MNRLARHGKDYELAPVFKEGALTCILTRKIRDHVDLWVAEQIPFEQILKKVKDQAMAVKLDTDVSRGEAGVAMGEQSDPAKHPGPPQFGGGHAGTDLNGISGKGPRVGWKGKRKGTGKGTDSPVVHEPLNYGLDH